jgi:hypothetical protein
MNINPEFSNSERPSSVDAMNSIMGYIWDKFIAPTKNNLNKEDADELITIGLIMKDIAEDAEAYNKMYEKNNFSRN